jgi:hypothetical protein
MSNEPAPPTPPAADPPKAPLPVLKQGSTQQAGEEAQTGRGALYSAAGTVALIAIGVGWGLWSAREEAKEEQPAIAPVKIDMPALKQRVGVQNEPARVSIKNTIARSTKASTQEDCEGMRKLLASAEKLAKTVAPDLVPEVQQAQRDLEARAPNLPNRADLAKKPAVPGEPTQIAPPPREVKP